MKVTICHTCGKKFKQFEHRRAKHCGTECRRNARAQSVKSGKSKPTPAVIYSEAAIRESARKQLQALIRVYGKSGGNL